MKDQVSRLPLKKRGRRRKETYSEESMKAAIKDVADGKYGPKKAGKVHRVPASTVYDHVSCCVQHMHSGRRPALTAAEESMLESCIFSETRRG